jgi:hypothetical protein
MNAPTNFKTLISLGCSAPRPGAPIRNFMVYILGHKGTMAQGTRHKGTTHYGEQSLNDQENSMITLMVLIMIDLVNKYNTNNLNIFYNNCDGYHTDQYSPLSTSRYRIQAAQANDELHHTSQA